VVHGKPWTRSERDADTGGPEEVFSSNVIVLVMRYPAVQGCDVRKCW
jgi:hypothetical protein